MTTAKKKAAKRRPYAPRMSREARREQLLDAALTLINEKGANALTMEAVAKGAGVTRPVVYDQFTDANHVLRVVLEREKHRALEQLVHILPLLSGRGDPITSATEAFERFIWAVRRKPKTWQYALMPPEGMPPAVAKVIDSTRDLILQQLTVLVESAMKATGANSLDVTLTAHSLLVFIMESGRLVITDPDQYSNERLSRFAKHLIRGLFASNH